METTIRKKNIQNPTLVGGFNPSEKYARQIGFIFPNFRGENNKIFKLPPPRNNMRPVQHVRNFVFYDGKIPGASEPPGRCNASHGLVQLRKWNLATWCSPFLRNPKTKVLMSQRILPAQYLEIGHDLRMDDTVILSMCVTCHQKLLYVFVVKLDEISWCLHSTLFDVGTHYHCSVLGQFDVGFHRQTTCSRWPVIRLQPNEQKWRFKRYTAKV